MPTPEPRTAPGGVIHDIGYQRYEGPRLGRRHIFGALYLHSLRTAFGLGRSAKAKIFPLLIMSVIGMVAVVLTAIRVQTGQAPVSYAQFPETLTILIVFFCAAVSPELVSRDLQNGVLPLYFARPLERTDYALAKLGALVTATFLLLAVPLTVMFAGAAFSAANLSGVWDEFGDYLPALLYSGLHAVVFSSVAVLVASLVKRRAVAAAAVVAAFLVTTPVQGVLLVLPYQTTSELSGLVNPASLVAGVGDWLFEKSNVLGIGGFGPIYGLVTVALVAGCVALLFARYRKVARS
ncbi:ABC transporter permease subunit [Micromonospora sp. NPDC050417]|uniref:ABC transporter permease subunit n=1 Tax=Micromonospora sp. NPDC050417 TaxID=3364280 RepID=UPI0037ACBA95